MRDRTRHILLRRLKSFGSFGMLDRLANERMARLDAPSPLGRAHDDAALPVRRASRLRPIATAPSLRLVAEPPLALGFDWEALERDDPPRLRSSGSLAIVREEKVTLPLVPCSQPLEPVSAPGSPSWRGAGAKLKLGVHGICWKCINVHGKYPKGLPKTRSALTKHRIDIDMEEACASPWW